jgi:tRNA dimethylallyltransferase
MSLQDRIANRFKAMLHTGLIEEVEKMRARGDLNADMPCLRAVGYRQVWDYLAGIIDKKEMEERAVIATRQLAKRQLTWLRQWPDLIAFDSQDPVLVTKIIRFIQ